jgi:hypothetical protein
MSSAWEYMLVRIPSRILDQLLNLFHIQLSRRHQLEAAN